jgi:hypothetical protein
MEKSGCEAEGPPPGGCFFNFGYLINNHYIWRRRIIHYEKHQKYASALNANWGFRSDG